MPDRNRTREELLAEIDALRSGVAPADAKARADIEVLRTARAAELRDVASEKAQEIEDLRAARASQVEGATSEAAQNLEQERQLLASEIERIRNERASMLSAQTAESAEALATEAVQRAASLAADSSGKAQDLAIERVARADELERMRVLRAQEEETRAGGKATDLAVSAALRASEIAQHTADQDRHLETINGSIERFANTLDALNQRLGRMEEGRTVEIAINDALKAALTQQTKHTLTNRTLWIAVASVVFPIILGIIGVLISLANSPLH